MRSKHDILLFTVIIFIFISALPAGLYAQVFQVVGQDGKKVREGFIFQRSSERNFTNSIETSSGNLFFRSSLSLETPAVSSYSFQSPNYSIDTSKTSNDTMQLLNGKSSAPAYSVNVIYVSSKSQQTSSQPAASSVSYYSRRFGDSYYTSGGTATTNTVNTTMTQTKTVTTPVTSTAVSTKTQAVKKVVSQNIKLDLGGSVSGVIKTQNGEYFPPESVVVTVSNSNNTFTKSVIVNTSNYQNAYTFKIDGIPPILQGSNDYYKVSMVSSNSYSMVANPVSNVKIYGNGQTVTVSPITMQSYRGQVYLTLYHGQNTLLENDADLLTLAQNAVINISGTTAQSRFVNESPRHFYKYVIDNAQAGTWDIQIMFPGHAVSGGTSVWVPANSSTSRLYTLKEM